MLLKPFCKNKDKRVMCTRMRRIMKIKKIKSIKKLFLRRINKLGSQLCILSTGSLIILSKIPRSRAEKVTPLFLIKNQQHKDQQTPFKMTLSSLVVINSLRLKEFSLALKRKAMSIQRMILRNLVHKIRELHRKWLNKSKIL